jgi:hypothetical protein
MISSDKPQDGIGPGVTDRMVESVNAIDRLHRALADFKASSDARHDNEHILMALHEFLTRLPKGFVSDAAVDRLHKLVLGLHTLDRGRVPEFLKPTEPAAGVVPHAQDVVISDLLESLRVYCRTVKKMRSNPAAANWISAELSRLGCRTYSSKALAAKFRSQRKHALVSRPIHDDDDARGVLRSIAGLLR